MPSTATGKHNIRGGKVLFLKDIEPHRPIIYSKDLPPPFYNQTFIHKESFEDTHPPPRPLALHISFYLTNLYLFLLLAEFY